MRKRQGLTEYIILVALLAIALILIVAVFGSNQKSLNQAANGTFKDGRKFSEMANAGAFDDTADNGRHRTGLLKGEAGGGGPSNGGSRGNTGDPKQAVSWKQQQDSKKQQAVKALTQNGPNSPQSQQALKNYYSTYDDPNQISQKQNYDTWFASGGSSSSSSSSSTSTSSDSGNASGVSSGSSSSSSSASNASNSSGNANSPNGTNGTGGDTSSGGLGGSSGSSGGSSGATETATVTASSLNVRSTGATSGGIITTVSKGTPLTVLGSQDGWSQVQLPNGKTGWVSSKYIASTSSSGGSGGSAGSSGGSSAGSGASGSNTASNAGNVNSSGVPEPYQQWMPHVIAASQKYGVPPEIVLGVISRETEGQNIRGDGGHGRGLMQIDDRSHQAWLKTHQQGMDPASNIDYGTSILAENYKKYGTWQPALAAYNSGQGNVDKALRKGLSPDTYTAHKNYGADVLKRAESFKKNLTPTTTTGASDAPPSGVVTSDSLNMREGAGTGNPVLKSLPKGTVVTILEKKQIGGGAGIPSDLYKAGKSFDSYNTFYAAFERWSDPDTDKGKASTDGAESRQYYGLKKDGKSEGDFRYATPTTVGVVAVDPKVIPYGSIVEMKDKEGNTLRFIAADTGGAVRSRKAAIENGSDRPVIDILLPESKWYKDVQGKEQTVTVYPYQGEKDFASLSNEEKNKIFNSVAPKGQTEEWYKVRLADGSEGWVSGTHLQTSTAGSGSGTNPSNESGYTGSYDGTKAAPGTTNTSAWTPVVAPVTSTTASRSVERYNDVLNQFAVGSNPRYARRNGNTYCNIFVWDATSAMGAEVPHWVDRNGNAVGQGEGTEMNANATNAWFKKHGASNGWREVTAEEAQANANAGRPSVISWKNPGGIGHIGMIRPGEITSKGASLAQAGSKNFNNGHVQDGFGNAADSSTYWIHD